MPSCKSNHQLTWSFTYCACHVGVRVSRRTSARNLFAQVVGQYAGSQIVAAEIGGKKMIEVRANVPPSQDWIVCPDM
jgi:hypothetical protein